MKPTTAARCALSTLTAALLAACGESQPPIAPGAMPAVSASFARAERGSWMLPEAKSEDLLYAADEKTNEVYVYAYPPGPRIGTLTGFSQPGSPCIDAKNDVFVPDDGNARIVEFAHGETKPRAILADSGEAPSGCSVDPATGDLAVANYCRPGPPSGCGAASVSIYRAAAGLPKILHDRHFYRLNDCTYDDAGNLFVVGAHRIPFQLFELRKDSKDFQFVKIHWTRSFRQIKNPGGLQWVAGRLLIGQSANEVSGPSIYLTSGASGHILRSMLPMLSSLSGIPQFWVVGKTVTVPKDRGGQPAKLLLYRYARRAKPFDVVNDAGQILSGVTVSLAPH